MSLSDSAVLLLGIGQGWGGGDISHAAAFARKDGTGHGSVFAPLGVSRFELLPCGCARHAPHLHAPPALPLPSLPSYHPFRFVTPPPFLRGTLELKCFAPLSLAFGWHGVGRQVWPLLIRLTIWISRANRRQPGNSSAYCIAWHQSSTSHQSRPPPQSML